MSKKPKININLNEDFRKFLCHNLLKLGYEVKEYETLEVVMLKFFNLKKRLVKPIPRKVLLSRELTIPLKLKEVVDEIRQRIENGDDIRSYLSKKILNLDFDDYLLNDWGIYHLHLGTDLDKSGFIKRTDEVLFIRFDEYIAYFISILPHRNWSNQELLKIIHRNWPKSISRYRMDEVKSVNPKLTDSEITRFRKNGMLYFVEIEEGAVYMPPGGGYASSGTSIEVVNISDYYLTRMKELEDHIKMNSEQLISQIQEKVNLVIDELNFHLVIENGEACLVEEKHGLAINCGEF